MSGVAPVVTQYIWREAARDSAGEYNGPEFCFAVVALCAIGVIGTWAVNELLTRLDGASRGR